MPRYVVLQITAVFQRGWVVILTEGARINPRLGPFILVIQDYPRKLVGAGVTNTYVVEPYLSDHHSVRSYLSLWGLPSYPAGSCHVPFSNQ